MRNAAKRAGAENLKVFSPLRGGGRNEPVILAFQTVQHEVCRGEVDIGKGMAHHAGKALIVYARNVGVLLVEDPHVLRGKTLAKSQKIRVLVADDSYPVVYREGREVPE